MLRLTKKKFFLLVGVPLTLLVGGALLFNVQALTDTIYPDGDITRDWSLRTGCTSTTLYACINETPHSTTNYINTGTSGTTGETVEFTMSSVAASNVNITQFAVTINAHSVACLGNSTNCDTLTVNIRKGGTTIGTATHSMTTANAAYTTNSTGGPWTSDSDLQVQVIRNRVGGGSSANADDDVRLTGLRAVVTYTQNYSIEQASYRWFDNTTATSGDTFSHIATAPFGTNGKSVAWSPNVEYLSIATESSPYVRVYKRSGDTLTALTGLPTFPNTTTGLAWSPDNTYMSVSHVGAPYIAIYKRSGDTFTKLTTPTIPAGNSNGISWSADGQYMSVAHANAPYISVYKRSGDTFTKLADPSSTPTGTGRSTSWSADGTYMSVSHEVSPFITIYKRSGDTFTKLANPTTLPTGIGNSTSWSADGQYMSVAHATSPFITIYKRSGDTFTKLANPTTLPTGIGNSTSWSADGQYMSVAHATSPFITIYKRSGDTFTKLANPTTLPGNTGNSVSWSSDGQYMSVAHDNTLAMTLYKRPLTADVGVPLAAVNTAATAPAPGTPFRLRLNLGVTGGNLSTGDYKLRYKYSSSGTCDASGTYNDVTASSVIKFYDNSTVGDKIGLTANANDPIRSGITAVHQTYNESNPFSVTTNIPAGQDGIWDFALTFDQTAQTTGAYCLKATTSANQDINTYSVIPKITVPPASYTQSSYRWYQNADSTTPGAPLTTQNTATAVAPETPFRLRQTIATDGNSLPANTSLKLQMGEKITTCSAAVYTDIVNDSSGNAGSTAFIENPTSITQVDPGGFETQPWGNIANVAQTDGLSAQVGKGIYPSYDSYDLKVSGFPMSIPAGEEIAGIEVRVTGNSNGQNVHVFGSGLSGNKPVSGTEIYGSPTSNPNVTAADLNNGSYVVSVFTSGSQDVFIDSIAIKVYYGSAVPVSATDIYFYDNLSANDDSSITPFASDPVSGRPQKHFTYNENGQFANTSSVIAGEDGVWDYSFISKPEANGKTYCMRIVRDDGSSTPLDTYAYYPEITIGTSGPTLDQQLRGGQSVVNGEKKPFTW